MSSLVEALAVLGLDDGVVVTDDAEWERKDGRFRIRAIPLWKWMLSERGRANAANVLANPPYHCKIVASLASTSSMMVAGMFSSLEPWREPMSRARG